RDTPPSESQNASRVSQAPYCAPINIYARTIPDRDRDEWVRIEIESNPLPICTRPQVLRKARRT
ncbi:major capsid protein, partial [Rubrimonas sp.]|uniref:major capsid protein n=1 Tax=Rubrimonas sp. TaxID=2036015 RepID=UPI002FDEEDD3